MKITSSFIILLHCYILKRNVVSCHKSCGRGHSLTFICVCKYVLRYQIHGYWSRLSPSSFITSTPYQNFSGAGSPPALGGTTKGCKGSPSRVPLSLASWGLFWSFSGYRRRSSKSLERTKTLPTLPLIQTPGSSPSTHLHCSFRPRHSC